MRKAKVAVLVSGGGTNLQALIDAERAGKMPSVELALVISNNRSAYALTRAEQAGIETAVIVRKEVASQEAFEAAMTEKLEKQQIDFIIMAGFMSILSKNFTDRYPEKIINIHPSLIPSFCGKGFYGLHVHEAALAYGVKVTGATVHFVNEIPDGGRIIRQKAVEVMESDTPEILQKRVMEQAEWIILPQAAEEVAEQLLNRERESQTK